MTPEEEADLAAMYADDDDGAEPVVTKQMLEKTGVQLEASRRFVIITVDGAKVRLPSMEFVSELDKLTKALAKENLHLKSQNKQMRQLLNQHSGYFNDVFADLDKKLNKRD